MLRVLIFFQDMKILAAAYVLALEIELIIKFHIVFICLVIGATRFIAAILTALRLITDGGLALTTEIGPASQAVSGFYYCFRAY